MERKLTVELISYPAKKEDPCAVAAATCTQPDPTKAGADMWKCLDGALASGHDSVMEHASFTFFISGISRACLAQLTRHRLASYSVQSQRYQRAEPDFVMPPAVKELGEEAMQEYEKEMRYLWAWYQLWLARGLAPEDARFVLPNACATQLTLTMNARELNHFFRLRCCNRAQWEIRELANQMLPLCQAVAPRLFQKAGPTCVATGHCPEGKRSCGRVKEGNDGI